VAGPVLQIVDTSESEQLLEKKKKKTVRFETSSSVGHSFFSFFSRYLFGRRNHPDTSEQLPEKKEKKTVRKKRKHPDSEGEAVVADEEATTSDEEATTSEDNEPVIGSYYLFRKRKQPGVVEEDQVEEDKEFLLWQEQAVVDLEGDFLSSEETTDSECESVKREYKLKKRTAGIPRGWLKKNWHAIIRILKRFQDELEEGDEVFEPGKTKITKADIKAAKLLIQQMRAEK